MPGGPPRPRSPSERGDRWRGAGRPSSLRAGGKLGKPWARSRGAPGGGREADAGAGGPCRGAAPAGGPGGVAGGGGRANQTVRLRKASAPASGPLDLTSCWRRRRAVFNRIARGDFPVRAVCRRPRRGREGGGARGPGRAGPPALAAAPRRSAGRAAELAPRPAVPRPAGPDLRDGPRAVARPQGWISGGRPPPAAGPRRARGRAGGGGGGWWGRGGAMVTLECECGFTCGTPAGLERHRARTSGEPVGGLPPPPAPPAPDPPRAPSPAPLPARPGLFGADA